MSQSIFLAASMNFYKELVRIEGELVTLGFDVVIPVSAIDMKKRNDFEVSHFKGVMTDEERSACIRTNFDNIKNVDAILVINNEKNGVKGYIGANVLMEIAFGYYFHKKIFILNPIPEGAGYQEELKIFGATIINGKLEDIHV